MLLLVFQQFEQQVEVEVVVRELIVLDDLFMFEFQFSVLDLSWMKLHLMII